MTLGAAKRIHCRHCFYQRCSVVLGPHKTLMNTIKSWTSYQWRRDVSSSYQNNIV